MIPPPQSSKFLLSCFRSILHNSKSPTIPTSATDLQHRNSFPSQRIRVLDDLFSFNPAALTWSLYSTGRCPRTCSTRAFSHSRSPCHRHPEGNGGAHAGEEEEGEGEEVVIALGSNMGDRVSNFDKALAMMKRSGISVVCHSSLYESAPAYVTDQPRFLNSAIKARTRLHPSALLAALKLIESDLGRVFGTLRYGPRPIDLDILFYGERAVNEDHLTIPHPRIWERPFVVAPLMDLCSANATDAWNRRLDRARDAWEQLDRSGLKQVIPSPIKPSEELWSCWQDKTYLMGILNITPDSFSDGGRYESVRDAVNRAESMASEGAHIIDVGAQSTRPGATKLSIDDELARLIPVLDAIRERPSMGSVCLSIDTFYSDVAREVVTKHGVHMVNDVSGGTLDPEMYATVGELGVPYILMHMRGDPTTMQNVDHVNYGDVVEDVAMELCDRLEKAESSGIPSWRIILDPGLGFSKTAPQNLRLLGNLSVLKSHLSRWSFAASKAPMLIGPSRKSFLGTVCGREKAEDRDLATVGAAIAGIAQGANILRLHNIKASADAVHVADAIFKPKSHWNQNPTEELFQNF